MRSLVVPLTFVLCAIVVLVGSHPLHKVKKPSSDTQNPATDESSVLSFESAQKEEGPNLIMGGYLSRIGRHTQSNREEIKQEINQEYVEESPRSQSEPDRENEIEVGQRKKRSSLPSDFSDEIVLSVDHDDDCRSPHCDDDAVVFYDDDVHPPTRFVDDRFDIIDEAPFPPSPPEEGVIQVDVVDEDDYRRKRSPSVLAAIPEPPFIDEDSEVPLPVPFEAPDRLSVFITGEPVIFHPQPSPMIEDVVEVGFIPPLVPNEDVVEVVLSPSEPVEEILDIEVVVDDDSFMKKKRSVTSSEDNLELKESQSEPSETVFNVGVKRGRRKRSSPTGRASSDNNTPSEDVIEVSVDMHRRKRAKKERNRSASSTKRAAQPNLA